LFGNSTVVLSVTGKLSTKTIHSSQKFHPLKIKPLWFLKMLGTNRLMMQHHIP